MYFISYSNCLYSWWNSMGNDYNPEMFQIPGNVCQNLRLLNIHLEVTVSWHRCVHAALMCSGCSQAAETSLTASLGDAAF